MDRTALTLSVLSGRYAICRLDPQAPVPDWATSLPFFSVTRTSGELSIVCLEARVPEEVRCERGWRVFELQGPFDLAATGILSSVLLPLAEAQVSIFAVSTHDTDYVLVREAQLSQAVSALRARGHSVRMESHGSS